MGQDQTISQLRRQNSQLKIANQSLKRDLELAQRLAELRKTSPSFDPPDFGVLRWGLYSLLAVVFSCWLIGSYSEKE